MAETLEFNVNVVTKRDLGSNRISTQEHFAHKITKIDPLEHGHGIERLVPSETDTQFENSENNFIYIKSVANANGLVMPFEVKVGLVGNPAITTKCFLYDGDPTDIFLSNPSASEEVIFEFYSVEDALAAPVVSSWTPDDLEVVNSLSSLTVVFDQHVSGVNASDLLVNGNPASGVTGAGDTWTFTFSEPSDGSVTLLLKSSSGIKNAFGKELVSDSITVTLDTVAPTLINRTPAPNTTVTVLTQVAIEFSEVVTGVDATDLLINGSPADSVIQAGNTWTFSSVQPASGLVTLQVLSGGIEDAAGNAFAGSTWQVTLS